MPLMVSDLISEYHIYSIYVLYVCMLLTYLSFSVTSKYYSTGSTVFDQIDNVHCTGTEPKLVDCSFNIVKLGAYTSVEMSCQYSKHDFVCVCKIFLALHIPNC